MSKPKINLHNGKKTTIQENAGYEDYAEPNRTLVYYFGQYRTIREKIILDRILEYWATRDQSDHI